MSWFALADQKAKRFCARGLGLDRSDTPLLSREPGAELLQGTIMVEADITGDRRPEDLIRFASGSGSVPRSFKLIAVPGGGVSLVWRYGRQTRHTALRHPGEGRTQTLRICFSWDRQHEWARLSVERQGDFRWESTTIETPHPMLVEDLHAMIMTRAGHSTNLVFAAVSDKVEPVGPQPGVSPVLPVETPAGFVPVAHLRRGDLVGRDGIPVLQQITRTVPARGSFRPLRLRAPYFGLHQDIVVSAQQRLILSGSDVEYMFAEEAVLVPAGQLVTDTNAVAQPCGPVLTYVQLLLPGHEALATHGCALDSLYMGRLRRKPQALAQTCLADTRRDLLPEHARPLFPVLAGYEAITLATRRAA